MTSTQIMQQTIPVLQPGQSILMTLDKWVVIPINLRDIYARVQADKIINWYGFKDEDYDYFEKTVRRNISTKIENSDYFVNAGNMFAYLWKHIDSINCGDIVNIVIPGLRNIYYNHRAFLSKDEKNLLETSMKQPLPQFLSIYGDNKNPTMEEYQLFGDITAYDVIHIPVISFIKSINDKKPLSIQLYPLNVKIVLTHSQSDLWDIEYQQIINYIDIQKICS